MKWALSGPAAELALHDGPSQLLESRKGLAFGTDQETEIVASHCHFHGLLVELFGGQAPLELERIEHAL